MTKLLQEQYLPISLTEAWDFFATPKNLNELTPPDVVFEILSEQPEKMYEGLFINYRVRPLWNIPLFWCTEITHIHEGEYFVDEQRKGPYGIWHHEHHFRAHNTGVMMTDILHYDIGWGFLGQLAGKLFIDRKVREIFEFRRQKLEMYF